MVVCPALSMWHPCCPASRLRYSLMLRCNCAGFFNIVLSSSSLCLLQTMISVPLASNVAPP